MDLWDYDVTPQEYMAAHYMQRLGGRVSGREIAERLQVSEATGRRVLVSLAAKGLIQRIARGRYALSWVSVEQSLVSVEQSPVSVSKVLSSTSSTYRSLEVPNGTSNGPAAPSRGSEDFSEVRFPVADDLEPGKLKPTQATPPAKKLFSKPDKYHRLTQPRETWGIPHVVKEFEIRALQELPNSVYVPEGKKLSMTLGMAARDYGLTVPQMLTAMDQFFRHEASKIPESTAPTRHFLAYLKRYIQQQPGFKGTVDFDKQGASADWERFNKGWT